MLSVSMLLVIVSLIPFVEVSIIFIFITLLTINSELIVILLYNYFIWTVFVLNFHVTKVLYYKRILCLNNVFIFDWYMAGCITKRFLASLNVLLISAVCMLTYGLIVQCHRIWFK